MGLTGNLSGKTKTSAEGKATSTGKKLGRPRKEPTAPVTGQPRGRKSTRTLALIELEADIDRLIFKVMGVGNLAEIEDSLRQARRLLYVSGSNGDLFRLRNMIPSTPGIPRRFFVGVPCDGMVVSEVPTDFPRKQQRLGLLPALVAMLSPTFCRKKDLLLLIYSDDVSNFQEKTDQRPGLLAPQEADQPLWLRLGRKGKVGRYTNEQLIRLYNKSGFMGSPTNSDLYAHFAGQTRSTSGLREEEQSPDPQHDRHRLS